MHKRNHRFFGLAALALFALLGFSPAAPARADLLTYDVTYSGAPYGNTAVGTGQITIDTSLINNPGSTTQNTSPFVTAFTLTISGATPPGNGTFVFANYNGAALSGGFAFHTSDPVDFSMDLAPQIFDFNFFSNGSNPNAPSGDAPNAIFSPGGEPLILISLAPAAPDPADLISDMIALMKSYGLPKGIENSFLVKPYAALSALAAEDTDAAISSLQAFINHAEAQSGKKLTVEQAQALIEAAQAIIDQISGP